MSRLSLRRSFAVVSVTALTAAALFATAVGPAEARVVAGKAKNADRTPVLVRDSEGYALQLCVSALHCEAAPAPPEIGSYYSAEADLGPMRAVYNVSAAFLEGPAGNPTKIPGLTNSALFRAQGLRPGRVYKMKDPWGTHRCTADGQGQLNNKNCIFDGGGEAGGSLASGPMKTFLHTTGGSAFAGSLIVPRRATGSPTGFNKVTLNGPGAHFSTNLWLIGGQLADNRPMSSVGKTSYRMGNRNNSARVTRIIRVHSVGTAPAGRVKINKLGASARAFKVANHCKTTVAPGRACKIRVVYKPRVTGSASAQLVLRDNTSAAPRHLLLKGVA